MSSRAFERMEGESSKAYRAFGVFRDLGPDRSLAKAAQLVYGTAANVRQMSRWSAKFDWVSRAQAYDDLAAMIGRQAIEENLREKAKDMANRETRLRERALDAREKALDQAQKILEWPLTEQRVAETDEDGHVRTLIIVPAHWSKATAIGLFRMAVGDGEPPEEEDPDALIDVSRWTEAELHQYVKLMRTAMDTERDTDRRQGPGAGK